VTRRGAGVLAAALAFVVTWLGSADAMAQRSREDLTVARARQLFAAGVQELDAGRRAEARELFQRALRLHDAPSIRWNLAACLHEAGELVAAREHLFAATRMDRDGTRRQRALELLASLDRRIAHVTVSLRGPVPGVAVWIDGDRVPPAGRGVPRPVDPGIVVVRAEAPGHLPVQREIVLDDGGEATLELTLVPEPGIVAASGAREPRRRDRPGRSTDVTAAEPHPETDDGSVLETWWFWTGVVAVVGGAATAVVLSLDADRPVGSVGGVVETLR